MTLQLVLIVQQENVKPLFATKFGTQVKLAKYSMVHNKNLFV